jgi:MFS superfamily sulfate permease-like transporter
MIFVVAKHHRHAHHKKDEPTSKLRKLAVPISLIVIFVYASQWAVRFYPSKATTNLAAGIAIAAGAAALWILYPRKDR